MWILRSCLAVTFLLCTSASSGVAKPVWHEFSTPHFTLYTPGESGDAIQALNRLETARFFLSSTPWAAGIPSAPVTIVAFDGTPDFPSYQSSPGAFSFYAHKRTRDYIFIKQLRGGPERAILHEYIHAVFSHFAPDLPLWLEEGLAEAYSSTQADGERVSFGAAIPAHLQLIPSHTLDSLRLGLGNETGLSLFALPADVQKFYATSWAAVRMILSSPKYSRQLPQFLKVVRRGATEASLASIYGVTLEELAKDLDQYVVGNEWRPLSASVLPLTVPVSDHDLLNEANLESTLAEFVVTKSQEAAAVELRLQELAGIESTNPLPDEALGFLALREHRTSDARAHFRSALTKGSTDRFVIKQARN